MPQMLRKQHWMKNLLQQEAVSETLCHWKTVKRRTSHRRLASLRRHWSKRTGQSPDKGHEQGMFRNFFGEVRTHLAVTEGNYVEPKTVYETKQADQWDQWYGAMKDVFKAFQDNETWDLVRTPTDRDVIPG